MTEDTDKEDEKFTAMENRLRRAIANNNEYHSDAPDVEDFDLWLESFEEKVTTGVPGELSANAKDDLKDMENIDLYNMLRERMYRVPEGVTIPKGTPLMRSLGDIGTEVKLYGFDEDVTVGGGFEYRTFTPLMPAIPGGTPGVWAGTFDCSMRRILVDTANWSFINDRRWRDGDGDTYRDNELVDPIPIFKEER